MVGGANARRMVMQRESPRALVLKPSGKKGGAHPPSRIFALDNALRTYRGAPKQYLVAGSIERNQSPCILMNFVEGRRSLVLAST